MKKVDELTKNRTEMFLGTYRMIMKCLNILMLEILKLVLKNVNLNATGFANFYNYIHFNQS